MGKYAQWIAEHRKALTAAAAGVLTVATYALGAQNKWVVLGGAVLGVLGVNFVPNAITKRQQAGRAEVPVGKGPG